MANARENFEAALITERVANRSKTSEYYDPPSSYYGREPEGALDLWDEAVRLFPRSLQREFDNPRDRGDASDYRLDKEVALSRESGIRLYVREVHDADQDEDGWSSYDSVDIEHELWVGDKGYDGESKNVRELSADIKKFVKLLQDEDPEGYEKFMGKA